MIFGAQVNQPPSRVQREMLGRLTPVFVAISAKLSVVFGEPRRPSHRYEAAANLWAGGRRFVWFHAKAGEGGRGARQDHDAEYNPISPREQEDEG